MQLKAYCEYLGGGYKYGMFAIVQSGVATIKVVAPGQWQVVIDNTIPVNEENGPQVLIGKCLEVDYNATLTFFVHSK